MLTARILVTGASGFLGCSLWNELGGRGYLARGAVRSQRPASGEWITVGDIGAATDWTSALSGVDCVIHCAARVHMMRDTVTNPLAAFRAVNVDGTLALARQAASAGVRRFVFVSSIKVNGEVTAPGAPFRADSAPAPSGDYAVSKWEAEQGLRAISAQMGVEVTVVRPPLVYGPGVGANFAAMMRWVARGVPLPLGGVDRNRRSLVALGNLVDLLATCIDHPAAAGETFLVGDGEDLSTAGLLRRMAGALGVAPRLVKVPPRLLRLAAAMAGKRDVAQRLLGTLQVDISKTQRLLGWRPPISVDDGLRLAADGILSKKVK